MRNNRIKKSAVQIVGLVAIRIIIWLWILSVLFPLVWYLYTSVKDSFEFAKDYWSFPTYLRFLNYADAFSSKSFPVGEYFFNSLLVTVAGVALVEIMVSTTSYAMAKFPFKWLKVVEVFYFAAMMIPSILLIVPLYTQLKSLSSALINNLFVLAVIYAVQAIPLQIFLVGKFVRGIDNGLMEAARIDGANEFTVFFRVVMPCLKPILFFVGLSATMAFWNEYTIALLFLRKPNFTLSIGLDNMKYEAMGDYGMIFAGLTIAMLPVLVLYSVFQKFIQNGVDMTEGVKG